MRTDIDNYTYDELAGFQVLDLGRKESKDEIWLSAGNDNILFSKISREILFTADFVQFLYNPETKQLLVAAAAAPGKNTIRITEAMRSTGVTSKVLFELLEKETKRDLYTVRIRLYGTKAKTKRSAIIYDLSSMVAMKLQKVNKRKKAE